MQATPPLAITMGCPVGIGPEIVCKFFASDYPDKDRFIVLGDVGVLRKTASLLDLELAVHSWQPGITVTKKGIFVAGLSNLDVDTLQWGAPTAETGQAMAEYISTAVSWCMEGKCSGMITCPISKKTLNAAGYAFPGHTEMLAALTATQHYRMMMYGSRLCVVLVTIHEPLEKVAQIVNREEIIDCINMTGHTLQRDFAIASPRIAVAALNPHAGEDSMFGDQEQNIIIPAVQQCENNWQVSGPWPPDTVFYKAANGEFDAVIAMYHDQGLIPFKLLHFSDGVNVTLGLPIVRTSVDHGTAYDIAGKGIADEQSLTAACDLAQRIVANRKNFTSKT